jgi:hypothetical protein
MAKKKATVEQSLIDSMAGVAAEVGASDDAIAGIAKLAKAQWDAALEVARLTDALKAAGDNLRKIAEVDLPEAMRAAGMESFKTTDGLQIDVKAEVKVGIPKVREEEAYKWLRDNGFDGLIKSDVDVTFSRDEVKKAQKLVDQLNKKGFNVSFSQGIHYQTLKSFVKERMADTESETPFPLDLFGAFPYTVATVKPTKERKRNSK